MIFGYNSVLFSIRNALESTQDFSKSRFSKRCVGPLNSQTTTKIHFLRRNPRFSKRLLVTNRRGPCTNQCSFRDFRKGTEMYLLPRVGPEIIFCNHLLLSVSLRSPQARAAKRCCFVHGRTYPSISIRVRLNFLN